ncbi:hypothetical protein [Alienimonas chondri]|uniref:Uncharacterized protein n=1 Tax=Alienimonas chondri TaxID=2681879 RepID=A0ABX1VDJ5_9PLAN|nr:hypothetical protein [Alienimonas chondri]NNJ25878.1 hypothetical protein [Alienimonas chondri]
MTDDLPATAPPDAEVPDGDERPLRHGWSRGLRWAGRAAWVAVGVAAFFHGVRTATDEYDDAVAAADDARFGWGVAVQYHNPRRPSAVRTICTAVRDTSGVDLLPPDGASAEGRAVRYVRIEGGTGPEKARDTLAAIAGMSAVTELVTTRSVPRDALDMIPTLPNLRRWSIDGESYYGDPWQPEVEDQLRIAARVPSLRVLALPHVELNDERLSLLSELDQVTTVLLSETTGAGAEEVRAAMPWAAVMR